MKKAIWTLSFVAAFCSGSFAQLEQGSKIIGGGVSFSYQPAEHSSFYGSINPFAQYFVVDNLAVGGGIGLSYSSHESASGTSSTYSVSVYPTVKYFVPVSGDLKPFTFAGVGYFYSKWDYQDQSSSSDGVSANAGIGVAYFLSSNIGLQGTLGYNHSFAVDNFGGANQLGFGIGLQIFIP